jgi:hypothetical protein
LQKKVVITDSSGAQQRRKARLVLTGNLSRRRQDLWSEQ